MNRRVLVSAALAFAVLLNLAACGGGETTTVIEEASTEATAESSKIEVLRLEKERAELEAETAKAEANREAKEAKKETRAQESVEVEPEPESQDVPDVVGMRLPEAQSTLKSAGYKAQAENTDTTFGIVIPSHYTICEQSEPHGHVVTVLAQKYGC